MAEEKKTEKRSASLVSSRQGGGGSMVWAVLLLAMALPVAAHFFGPWQGWLGFLWEEPEKAPLPVVPPALGPVPPDVPPPPPDPVPSLPPEPDALEPVPVFSAEARFAELLAGYREKFPSPEVGKAYTVHLRDGKEDRGELVEFGDGRIVLKMEYGQISYPLSAVSPRSYPELFPGQAAKMLAMRDLNREIQERQAAAGKVATSAGRDDGDGGDDAGVVAGGRRYDPSPATTPEQLRKAVDEFGLWLQAQQRRMGGQVAQKIHAKQHGGHAVLYLETSRNFQRQSYDFRFTVTEALWNIWAFKCLDFGHVADMNRAHVILLGPGRQIIGGSIEDDGAAIWVNK